MSTRMTFMSLLKRGGAPNWMIQLKRVPTTRQTSASTKAVLRALRNASGWSSGTVPRESGVV